MGEKITAEDFLKEGILYFEAGESAIAIKEFDKGIELVQGFDGLRKGEHDKAIMNFDKSIMNFDKAIELEPDHTDSFFYRGSAYLLKGEHDKAILDFDKAIELEPDNSRAYANRGIIYSCIGEQNNAILNYDKAIELEPDIAEVYYKRGVAYKFKGEHDNAILNYDKAIELKPDFAGAYFNRGGAYSDKGEYDNTILNYNKAIDLKPDYAEAYYNRGVMYGKKMEYHKAIMNYDKAIDLKPDFAEAYFNRGIAYSDKEEYVNAITNYNKVIEFDPFDAVAYNNRGNAYSMKREYDNAIVNYDKAIELKPDFAAAYSNRGVAYYDKGEDNKAITNFDEEIELDPDSAGAYSNKGIIYAQNGKYDKAMMNYNKAIEIKPEFPNPYYGKAKLLLKKEESFLAFTYLLRYYFLEPHDNFLNNCFEYVEKFKDSELQAPLFLYRVFKENQSLLTAFSFEHLYEEICEDSSQKLAIIKSIGEQDPNENDDFIDNDFIISVDEISGYKIKGLLYYYYGDPIYAKKMFDEIDSLDETDMMGQYYLIMSLIQYLEDYSGELESALIQCMQLLDKNEKDKVQLYYAGQIYILNNDPDSALKCFTKSNDFLPSRFMQVVIHNRLENKIQLKKCIKSIFESTGDDELEELKLLLNGNIIETDLEDENWVNSLLFNAHVNEISDARNIIFDWLDDEQNKKFYPQYWEQGLIFDYNTDAERKAYKVWKVTEETSRKLNDLSESLKLKYFTKLESKVKEQFPDIFDLLDSLDGNRLESIIANKIQELKITDIEKEKYSVLIAYSYLKEKLSIHQNIFLNSFLVVKFHFDNQKEWQIGGRLFEAAIMVSFATPLSEFIGHTIGVHHILPHIFFHTVGQTFYQKTDHFLKTKVLDKLRKKRNTSEPLTYNEFKKMYIEYVSELKEEEVNLFEKWDIDGLEEWFEENK